MTVGKYFTNKAKTKSKWWFVTRVKTGEFDRFGNPITRQIRKKGFATREKAKEAERKFLNDYDNNKVETNKDLTLGDISQLFFDYIENEGQYAKSTIYNYRVYYNKYIKEPLGNIPISKLSFDIVQKFFRKLYNGVSVHVYNHCLKFVKRAFNYAIEIDKIAVNPFTKIKPLRCEDKVRNRFSVEDMKIVIEKCKKLMPEFYCILVLGAMTGMRLGEYSALRPNDIKPKGNHYAVYVCKQITKNEYKNELKTKKSRRVVDISDNVYEIIQWHIRKYNIANDNFLFKTSTGRMLYPKWVQRRFERLLEICGYPEKYMRVHDLRGQYVDFMHLCGVPTVYIAQQVGHSDEKVTYRTYTQILNELPEGANRKLDSLIFGPKEDNEENKS